MDRETWDGVPSGRVSKRLCGDYPGTKHTAEVRLAGDSVVLAPTVNGPGTDGASGQG